MSPGRLRTGGWRSAELAFAVLLVALLLVGVDRFSTSLQDGAEIAPPAVPSLDALPAVVDPFPPSPRTFRGPVYGIPDYSPTADKPQSKLWHHDRSWWALMSSAGTRAVHVFTLSDDLSAWRDTGTVVDTRPDSRGDAEAVGDVVYVASRGAGHINVTKLVYNRGRRAYDAAPGFPMPVVVGATESVTLTLDSRQRVWLTYQQRRRILVAHSMADDRQWSESFAPGTEAQRVSADDISTIVSFGGAVGVMWSDQASGAFRFAVHDDDDPDEVWRVETPLEGKDTADDHIAAAVTSDGRVLAVVKTSNSDVPEAADKPGVLLLVRQPDGVWGATPVTTAAEDWTRPILVLHENSDEILVFATSSTRGGSIQMRCSPLSRIDFSATRVEPFIHPHEFVNNATSTKSGADESTDLVVLASTGGTAARYYYAVLRLGRPDLAAGPPASGREPTTEARTCGARL